MHQVLEHYLEDKMSSCRPRTVTRITYVLGMFETWICDTEKLHYWYEVSADHIARWVAMKSRTVQIRTLFFYRDEVRQFFRWLYDAEYLLVNPWDESLESKRPPYKMRRAPSVAQAETILQKVVEQRHNALRDRAILEIVYGCGLRRREVAQLNISDMREEWLKVRGKGDRERLVPLGAQARQWITLYMKEDRSEIVLQKNIYEEALFLTREGTRLGVASYGYILSKHNLSKVTTLHGFRHACATHMLRNGANIRLLQKLLGHKKLSSTELYTKVDTRSMKRALSLYHPRG